MAPNAMAALNCGGTLFSVRNASIFSLPRATKIEAFLKENKVPPQFNADMVIGAMKGGQITPKAMIDRMKQMGGGGGAASGAAGAKPGEAGAREREVLAWVAANAPGAFSAVTPVTLPD